jgi:hypothetical protein
MTVELWHLPSGREAWPFAPEARVRGRRPFAA